MIIKQKQLIFEGNILQKIFSVNTQAYDLSKLTKNLIN
jgi:hypothetical protein